MRLDCTPEVKPNSNTPPGDTNVALPMMVELAASELVMDGDWAVPDTMRQTRNTTRKVDVKGRGDLKLSKSLHAAAIALFLTALTISTRTVDNVQCSLLMWWP